jgi:hypothetical protein
MYAARSITVILLIFAILVAYNPQVREKGAESWEIMRPSVVALMDNVYAAVRGVIAGNDSKDWMETPSPVSPSANFERIVTLSDNDMPS